MAKILFTLNGKTAAGESSATILEAVRQNGTEIPTLCHDPRLKPTAACRLCLVQVEGAKGPMPACATQLNAGMKISTDTEAIFKLRQMALELLLSDHYGDCVAPCQLACPAGIDIQGYVALIANGQYQEALKLIKESNPLPLVCGRVCPAFCEKKCRRNLLEAPVAINSLKRFVADYDLNSKTPYKPEVKPSTGRKIAIIGGGPAGLTAAYYSAIAGHEVTIFESSPQLGGMLRYGIPEYRLPKAILDKEIESITSLCHQVKFNVSMGVDFTIKSLKDEGFEAIFIALGAQHSQKLNVEGEDLPGVVTGIGFLRNVIMNRLSNPGKKVVVIGGGNTAIDAARTALRVGASEVAIAYRRSRDEMPANPAEVKEAEREGVKLFLLSAPVKIIGKNGKARMLQCVKMALGEPDASGRRKPEPIAGSEFIIEADTIIAAIGQTVDTSGVPADIKNEKGQALLSSKETTATNQPGVFAGGDCTSGPATVVEAIAAGKKAARSINLFLNGQKIEPLQKSYNCSKGELKDISPEDYLDIVRTERAAMPELALSERKENFQETELGFTEDQVKQETTRCLSCGCQAVFECKLRQYATEYKVDDKKYAGKKHHVPVYANEHADIIIDHNKCILCGRCVRICTEVEGVGALGFLKRGFNTQVGPGIGMLLSQTLCNSCGQCVSTCPTGALVAKSHLNKPGPWKLKSADSVCPECGVGCNISLNMAGGKVISISSNASGINGGNLCKKGQFDYLKTQNEKRVTSPMVKRGDEMVEASWQEASELIHKEMKPLLSDESGNKLAVLSSGKLTCEESYIVQKFARTVLHTNNIAGSSIVNSKDSLVANQTMKGITFNLKDLSNSDLILAIGADIAYEYPVIGSKIRKSLERGGKLIVVSPSITRLDPVAKIDLRVNPRTMSAFLRALLNYIIVHNLQDAEFIRTRTSGYEKLVADIKKYSFNDITDLFWFKPAKIIEAILLYVRAKNPVILVNANTVGPEQIAMIKDLALITGNAGRTGAGVMVLHTPGNVQGVLNMGISNLCLPIGLPVTDQKVRGKFETAWKTTIPSEKGKDLDEIIEGVENEEIAGLVVFGLDAPGKTGNSIFKSAKFSILVDTTIPAGAPLPDLLLPMATAAESEGTFINCEGRIQYLNRAVAPAGSKSNLEIVSFLAKALDSEMKYRNIAEVAEEISGLVPAYRAKIDPSKWQSNPDKISDSSNAPASNSQSGSNLKVQGI